MHRRHRIFNLIETILTVFNLKPKKSKANNMKQIIHYLGKQNIVLNQTAC